MIEEILPIVLFLVIALIVYVLAYFRFRARQELHLTVRGALDKGVELPSVLLESLQNDANGRLSDFRRGVLFVALALALFALAMMLGQPEVMRPLLGAGMFPFLFGLAYLGLWRFGRPADGSAG